MASVSEGKYSVNSAKFCQVLPSQSQKTNAETKTENSASDREVGMEEKSMPD